jgi:hypothetical protein
LLPSFPDPGLFAAPLTHRTRPAPAKPITDQAEDDANLNHLNHVDERPLPPVK